MIRKAIRMRKRAPYAATGRNDLAFSLLAIAAIFGLALCGSAGDETPASDPAASVRTTDAAPALQSGKDPL